MWGPDHVPPAARAVGLQNKRRSPRRTRKGTRIGGMEVYLMEGQLARNVFVWRSPGRVAGLSRPPFLASNRQRSLSKAACRAAGRHTGVSARLLQESPLHLSHRTSSSCTARPGAPESLMICTLHHRIRHGVEADRYGPAVRCITSFMVPSVAL